MHKQLLPDKRWLATSSFVAFMVLTLLPLVFVQPGMLVIGLLFISSLIGLAFFVQDQ